MRSLATTVVRNTALGSPKQTLAAIQTAAPFDATTRGRCLGKRIQRGFTLLELILALSLTVVVMTLIFGAINAYVFQVTKQQARIERELVSRSVLKIMANDIRAALESRPIQYNGINAFLESATLNKRAASGELRLEDAGAAAAAAKLAADKKSKDQRERANSFRPRFSGSSRTITFDLRRPANISRLNPSNASVDWEQRSAVSNIRSVSYFYSSPSEGTTSGSPVSGGMYRRDVPRRTSQLSEPPDPSGNLAESSELLAAEVAEIGFRYFDGRDWLDAWDSASSQTFPAAVEISLIMAPHTTKSSSLQRSGQAPARQRQQLIVYRPSIEPAQVQP